MGATVEIPNLFFLVVLGPLVCWRFDTWVVAFLVTHYRLSKKNRARSVQLIDPPRVESPGGLQTTDGAWRMPAHPGRDRRSGQVRRLLRLRAPPACCCLLDCRASFFSLEELRYIFPCTELAPHQTPTIIPGKDGSMDVSCRSSTGSIRSCGWPRHRHARSTGNWRGDALALSPMRGRKRTSRYGDTIIKLLESFWAGRRGAAEALAGAVENKKTK